MTIIKGTMSSLMFNGIDLLKLRRGLNPAIINAANELDFTVVDRGTEKHPWPEPGSTDWLERTWYVQFRRPRSKRRRIRDKWRRRPRNWTLVFTRSALDAYLKAGCNHIEPRPLPVIRWIGGAL